MLSVSSCEHPQVIWRRVGVNPKTGKHYTAASVDDLHKWSACSFEELPVRCGKCFGCLKAKASGLLARCVAESRMHEGNAFLTLTVDDDNLEFVFPGRSLLHRPWQLYFKRLRKTLGVDHPPIKYMMCGEYGETSCRPHYHALVFGVSAFDWLDTNVSTGRFGETYKQRVDNPVFQQCWPFGNVFLGSLTPASVAYVCGYTLKQYQLGRDDAWYLSRGLAKEYIKWSRRPGIGRSYFDQFGLDLLGDDSAGVSIEGKRLYAGRYFSDWLRLTYPQAYDTLFADVTDQDFTRSDFYLALDRRDRRLVSQMYAVERQKRI